MSIGVESPDFSVNGNRVSTDGRPERKPGLLIDATALFAEKIHMLGYEDEDDETAWQESALCAQTDPELFFPEKNGSAKGAKKVCARCEVEADCLRYTLEHDENHGVWGGLSENQRRRLKRRLGQSAAH